MIKAFYFHGKIRSSTAVNGSQRIESARALVQISLSARSALRAHRAKAAHKLPAATRQIGRCEIAMSTLQDAKFVRNQVRKMLGSRDAKFAKCSPRKMRTSQNAISKFPKRQLHLAKFAKVQTRKMRNSRNARILRRAACQILHIILRSSSEK